MRHSYAGDAHRRFNGGGGGCATVIVVIAMIVWLVSTCAEGAELPHPSMGVAWGKICTVGEYPPCRSDCTYDDDDPWDKPFDWAKAVDDPDPKQRVTKEAYWAEPGRREQAERDKREAIARQCAEQLRAQRQALGLVWSNPCHSHKAYRAKGLLFHCTLGPFADIRSPERSTPAQEVWANYARGDFEELVRYQANPPPWHLKRWECSNLVGWGAEHQFRQKQCSPEYWLALFERRKTDCRIFGDCR